MSKRLASLTAKQLIRFFKKQGFVKDGQSGSHLTMKHLSKNRTVTIPVHTGTNIGKGLLKKMLSDAGFTLDQFLNLK